MDQKLEVTPPTLTGELTVRAGVLAKAKLTIYNKNIIGFNIWVAIEGTAEFQLKQGDSYLRLSIDVLLLIDGQVMTVKIKWGWRPRLTFPMRSFQLLYHRWNIYTFELTKQPALGAVPNLTVDSSGAKDVVINSTTGHGGLTLYALPVNDPDTEVHLEAPEVIGSGLVARYFTHWSGDVESADRSITFTMGESANVTANYGDLFSSFKGLPLLGEQVRTLSVESSGASGVSISSNTGHGGATKYEKTLEDGTEVHLEAPGYVGAGQDRKRFSEWTGDVSSKERDIELSMDADYSVAANYVDDPETATEVTLSVSSQGASKVPISSATGHGGTTNYVKTLAAGTQVTLTTPEYVGWGEDRKRFSQWTGAVTGPNRTINLSMTADRVVMAVYVDDPEEVRVLTKNDAGGSFDLVVGETFRVELPANHTTLYRWWYTVSHEGVLELLDDEYIPTPQEPGFVGGGGTRIFTFTVLKKGYVAVTFKHAPSETAEGETLVYHFLAN